MITDHEAECPACGEPIYIRVHSPHEIELPTDCPACEEGFSDATQHDMQANALAEHEELVQVRHYR